MKSTLIVNNRWGYVFQPEECKSIAEAYRLGKDYPGFYFRIYVDGKFKRDGYCDN